MGCVGGVFKSVVLRPFGLFWLFEAFLGIIKSSLDDFCVLRMFPELIVCGRMFRAVSGSLS